MVAELRAILPMALPTSITAAGPTATAGNDLFEAFLFTLVLRAAEREGYQITFSQGWGTPPSVFRLRRSPGRLATGGEFTHATLALPGTRGRPLEVHTGVAVIGSSKVAHEADVLVLPVNEAQRCRRMRVDPPNRAALLVIEGKYYSRPLTLGVGREFLGLAAEVTKDKTMFAATITSPSVSRLLSKRKMSFEVGVLPSRKGARDLQDRIGQVLRSHARGT